MNYNDSVMQVRVEDINHVYTQLKGRPRSALEHVSLEIPDGQFVCILGPSGCGKSTLLRILAGLLEPTSGSVLLDDNAPDQALALKQIGWMAQNPALLPWRTVEQNIALAQTVNPQNGRRLLSPAELLTLVRLDGVARAYPAALSGGMQHRTALARTIALGARLWLMDEPFAALDEFTRTALADELIAIWGAFRTTVVWVTHHVYEAVRLADRILVMSHAPGTVINDFPVQLARPRLESDPEFTALAASVRAAAGSAAEAGSPPLSTPYAKQILGSI